MARLKSGLVESTLIKGGGENVLIPSNLSRGAWRFGGIAFLIASSCLIPFSSMAQTSAGGDGRSRSREEMRPPLSSEIALRIMRHGPKPFETHYGACSFEQIDHIGHTDGSYDTWRIVCSRFDAVSFWLPSYTYKASVDTVGGFSIKVRQWHATAPFKVGERLRLRGSSRVEILRGVKPCDHCASDWACTVDGVANLDCEGWFVPVAPRTSITFGCLSLRSAGK